MPISALEIFANTIKKTQQGKHELMLHVITAANDLPLNKIILARINVELPELVEELSLTLELDANNNTTLHLAAILNQVGFQDFISRTSPHEINKALVIKNDEGDTPLIIVANHQESADFQALINKASPDAINAALVIKNAKGETPLGCAAYKISSAGFQVLINKASSEAINIALVIENDNRDTPLSIAARFQRSSDFKALINKASQDAINAALVITNDNRDTPLGLAAGNQGSAVFQALINKASPDAINAALVIKNAKGETPLSIAARCKDFTGFQALINKASSAAILRCFNSASFSMSTLQKIYEERGMPLLGITLLKLIQDNVETKQFLPYKKQLKDYIINLQNARLKAQLLASSLDNKTALGKFFSTKRGLFASKNLKELKEAAEEKVGNQNRRN